MSDYKEMNGVSVPATIEAIWKLEKVTTALKPQEYKLIK